MKNNKKTLICSISFMAAAFITPSFCAFAEESRITQPSLGLSYLYSQEMKDTGLSVYPMGITPLREIGELQFYYDTTLLGAILVMEDDLFENGYGEQNALDYYQSYYTDYNFSEDQNENYHYVMLDAAKTTDASSIPAECLKSYSELLDSIEYIPLEPETISSKLTFQTLNLEGEEVTDSILTEKDITIINVWATFCNPCINEMPDLAQWEEELPENVQLLYLCSDINSEDSSNIELAELIVKKSGINKKHVLYQLNGSFEALEPFVTAVPTTFFIDKNGQVLDEIIVGAYIDKYKETLENLLKK